MEITSGNTKLIAYGIIIVGCGLAAYDAVQPQFGHFHLMFGTLLFGILPYLVYGFLSDILRPRALLVVGAVVLGIDILARLAGLGHAATGTDRLIWAYLPLWLAVLPIMALAAGQYDLPEREHTQAGASPK